MEERQRRPVCIRLVASANRSIRKIISSGGNHVRRNALRRCCMWVSVPVYGTPGRPRAVQRLSLAPQHPGAEPDAFSFRIMDPSWCVWLARARGGSIFPIPSRIRRLRQEGRRILLQCPKSSCIREEFRVRDRRKFEVPCQACDKDGTTRRSDLASATFPSSSPYRMARAACCCLDGALRHVSAGSG